LTGANAAVSQLPGPTSGGGEQEANIIQKFSQEHHRRKFQGPGTWKLTSTLSDELEENDYESVVNETVYKSFARNNWQVKTIWES